MELRGINLQQYEAWRSVIGNITMRHTEILKAIHDLGGEATAEMIAKKLDRLTYLVSPRITELLEKQLIFDTGKVIPNQSMRNATVWAISEKVDQSIFS